MDAKNKPGAFKCIVKAFGFCYFVSGIWQFGYIMLQFASPQIVNLLIAFVQNDEPTWRGYFYTVLICAATFACTIFNSQCFSYTNRILSSKATLKSEM